MSRAPGDAPGSDATLVHQPTATAVWPLAWPTMLSFLLNSLVGVVDFMIVSRLGTEQVAAAGVALQLHFALFAVLAAVNTGTTALVARSVGRGDMLEADRVFRVSVLLASGLGVLTMVSIVLADPLIAVFDLAPDVARQSARYLGILFAFNVPFFFILVASSALRGAGDVRTPLWIGALVNVVNVLGNYSLVFGRFGMPRLGLEGSALGTGVALCFGALLFGVLWVRNDFVIPRHGWLDGVTRARSWRILRIGLPTALEQTAFQLGLILFIRLVAQYGTEPVSAYLIGIRILALSFVPGLGFNAAASTLVGQYLGAEQPEAATRFGWRSNAGAMLVMGAVGATIVAFARPLAELFGAAGDETVSLTVKFIFILGAAQPLMAVEFALGGALRGAGDTRFPLYVILTGLFVFRLGTALLVWGWLEGSVVAVWSCLLADYSVKALMLAGRFRSGRWQHVRV